MVNLSLVSKMKRKNKVFFLLVALAALAVGRECVAQEEMTEYPRVRLQTLDKATARTQTFNVKVGSTVKFGPLFIRPRSCKKSSPLEEPESASFLEIWEVTPSEESKWVFSGWMFASSPGLSSMDHPIYDVWVLNCLDYDAKILPGEEDTGEDIEPPDETPFPPSDD